MARCVTVGGRRIAEVCCYFHVGCCALLCWIGGRATFGIGPRVLGHAWDLAYALPLELSLRRRLGGASLIAK